MGVAVQKIVFPVEGRSGEGVAAAMSKARNLVGVSVQDVGEGPGGAVQRVVPALGEAAHLVGVAVGLAPVQGVVSAGGEPAHEPGVTENRPPPRPFSALAD